MPLNQILIGVFLVLVVLYLMKRRSRLNKSND
jgi:hypothetical protein